MENNTNLEYIFKSLNTNDKELLDSYLESIILFGQVTILIRMYLKKI